MLSQGNISRPYAQALFEFAQESDQLSQWQQQLDLLAVVANDADFARMVESPQVSNPQIEQLVVDVCQGQLTDSAINLVKLLVRNGRLAAIPAIAQAYSVLKSQQEQVVKAKMMTATEIDKQHQQRFVDTLKEKFGKSVTIEFGVDDTLLGGAVISAGDWVIDGSVKSQLEQLKNVLGA